MRWTPATRVLAAIAALLAIGTVCAVIWRLERLPKTITLPDRSAFLPPDKLPDSWNLEEIAERTLPYGHKGTEGVYVLAWQIQDRKGWKLESCLVMRVLEEDDGRGRWCLTHLYRHPGGKWDISKVHALNYGWISYYMWFKTR